MLTRDPSKGLTATSFLETVSLRLEMIMEVMVVRPFGLLAAGGRGARGLVNWLS